MGRGWKDFEEHAREGLNCLEQTVNMLPMRGQKEMRKNVFVNWRKEDPCQEVIET